MEREPLVTVTIVVHNGERYIRHCLAAVREQTYPNLEVNVFDNHSSDDTRRIVREEFSEFRLIEHPENIGMWPGQEEALRYSRGQYILALSVDVMLTPTFVRNAVHVAENDAAIGAIQAKMYQYSAEELESGGHHLRGTVLDTCGFKLLRSRRVTNIGHGQPDRGQYDEQREVFAVEGAAPFFRRTALEALRVGGSIADRDYFWYGDDLDLGWRMRLFGFKQVYAPRVIAYHDRSTTKGIAANWLGAVRRIRERRRIPLFKRRLDWANVRFTIIKNDYIINILKDLPWIVAREVATLGYILLFEPGVLGAAVRFLRLLPRMLAKRRRILARATVSAGAMHRWFVS